MESLGRKPLEGVLREGGCWPRRGFWEVEEGGLEMLKHRALSMCGGAGQFSV